MKTIPRYPNARAIYSARCPAPGCNHASTASTSDALYESMRDHVRLHGWTMKPRHAHAPPQKEGTR